MASSFPVLEINRTDRSTRRRLGKDDAIDAEAAARAFIADFSKAIKIQQLTAELVPSIRSKQSW